MKCVEQSYTCKNSTFIPDNKFIFETYIKAILNEVNKNYRLKYFYYDGTSDDHYKITLPLKPESMPTQIKKISLETLVVNAMRHAKQGVFFQNKRYQRTKGINVGENGYWLVASGGNPYLEINVESDSIMNSFEATDHCGGTLQHIVQHVGKKAGRWKSDLVLEVDNRHINDECRHRRETLIAIYDKINEWYKANEKDYIVTKVGGAKH